MSYNYTINNINTTTTTTNNNDGDDDDDDDPDHSYYNWSNHLVKTGWEATDWR